MSHEKWLVTGLTLTVITLLALVSALTWQLGWSRLAIATLVFMLSYPLVWLAWFCYRFWRDAIMQLTTYTQVLKEGERNLRFKKQNSTNLLLELQKEINALANVNYQEKQQEQILDSVLSHILDAWSMPVCLFDERHKLCYRNTAMNEQVQQPMLIGTPAKVLGFQFNKDSFQHAQFDQGWQCQSISYSYHNRKHWLFSALDVSQRLQQNQSITQQNLIRVLGHELRNSLTPMASMADTLLSADTLNEQQVRLVLTRIQKRSDRLLTFISQYSQLSQLPKPKSSWFDFSDILEEAKAMAGEHCQIDFQGNSQCFGDSLQVSQVVINLVKNAQEACLAKASHISIKIYYQQNEQIIEVTDNGPGFANLDNVLTPFYTTKEHGSGIGLSLCAEIASNHGGQLKVANRNTGGANITLSWPISHSQ